MTARAPLPLGSFRIVFPELAWPCDDCGQLIPPGETLVAWNGQRVTHEGRCPPPWSPTVIEGGSKVASRRLSEPVQLALSLLAAVEDEP